MRIQCGSIEEFLSELEIEAGQGRVWRKIVRLQIERVPEQEQHISFRVAFVGTVLLGIERPEQLLEFSGWAGTDDRRNGDLGTKEAEAWQGQVKALCDTSGLLLRRGRYELI